MMDERIWRMRSRGSRRGFTLIEIVLALGIAFFVMAALYQAILSQSLYQDAVSTSVEESQTALAVLHQIADEIKSIAALPPVKPSESASLEETRVDAFDAASFAVSDAPRSQTFFTQPPTDEYSWLTRLVAAGTSGLAGEQNDRPLETVNEQVDPEFVLKPFGLVGRRDCIVMLIPSAPLGPSDAPLAESLAAGGSALPVGGRDSQPPQSAFRQVMYFLRPAPSLEAATSLEPAATDGKDSGHRDAALVRDARRYRGLVRQEAIVPTLSQAQFEARRQVQEWRRETTDENDAVVPTSTANNENFAAPANDFAGRANLAAAPHTRLIAEKVTAIRFRYWTGSMWMESWDAPTILPLAVEVGVCFDRGADEFSELPTREQHGFSLGGSPSFNAPSAGANAPIPDDFEREHFFYRLVIALPSAERIDRSPAEALIGSPAP